MTICDRKRHRRLAAAAVAAACLSASSAASPDRAEEGVANANAAARRLRGKIDSNPTPTVATASTWSGQGAGGVPGFNDGVEHGIDGDGVGMYDFGPDDMPLYLADPRQGADGGDDEDLNNVKSPMWGPTPDLTVALPEEVEAKESPSANDGRLSASGDWATKAAAEDVAEDAALEDEKSSGARGPAGRVVGGQQARIPSFVMTLDNQNGKNFRGVCGATCVSKGCRFALTAAHCISNYKKDDLRHRMDFGYVGAFTPWSQAGGKNGGMGYDILEVANVFTHPGHVPGSASKHDIAIIEYKMPGVNPTKFPDFEPMPICDFPMETSKYTMSGQKGTVAGVGQTSYSGSKSDRLMEVDVNYMRRSTCRSIMKSRNMEVTEDMVCFGGNRNGKDACGGDSGGPVVLGGFQNGCLAGVVSWGYKCAEPGYPGVYSSVEYHFDWIKSIIDGYTLQDVTRMRTDYGTNRLAPEAEEAMAVVISPTRRPTWSTSPVPVPAPTAPAAQPATTSAWSWANGSWGQQPTAGAAPAPTRRPTWYASPVTAGPAPTAAPPSDDTKSNLGTFNFQYSFAKCATWVQYQTGSVTRNRSCGEIRGSKADRLCSLDLADGTGQVWDVCCGACYVQRGRSGGR